MRNLMREGLRPDDIDALFFTHMHQDHYISLPSFLFYLLNGPHDAGGLTIYGPEGVKDIVEQALAFCMKQRDFKQVASPKVVQLQPGQGVELLDIRVTTQSSRHPVPGLLYRFSDRQTGKCFVYSGDTESFPGVAEFARGSELLIHEHSLGAHRQSDRPNTALHSSASEAAQTARDAGVEALYMVHGPARPEDLAAAREIFTNSHLARAGERIEV